jgi:hypothetical protein
MHQLQAIYIAKVNTGSLLYDSKGDGLEIKAKKTKYFYMFTSRHQTAGQIIKKAVNIFLENVAYLK